MTHVGPDGLYLVEGPPPPSQWEKIIDEGSRGNPDAKWYEFSLSTACPIPMPENPTTRKVVLGVIALGTAAAVWWNSAHLPSLDTMQSSEPVPALKK